MAIGPIDHYGELNPDYLLDAEHQDWERLIPDEDWEWLDWWLSRTYRTKVAARLRAKELPYVA